jgi:hypothetical protein
VPITFALSVQEAEQLVYVEEFASSLRLALRSPEDTTQLELDDRIYQPRRGGGDQDDLLAPSDDLAPGLPQVPSLPGQDEGGDGDDTAAGGGAVPPPVPGGGR